MWNNTNFYISFGVKWYRYYGKWFGRMVKVENIFMKF